MNLVPIGRFSKMTRLSIRALRLYDESGLLRPAHVDPSSGYRYYDLGQANRAEAVRILRSVDMPLDEIVAVLETDDPELVHKQLIIHRERLAERLATQERMLAYLESLIQRKEGIMPYDVQILEEMPRLVAATKVRTNLRRIGDDIGAGFGTLMQGLGRAGIAPSGAPLIVYHDVIDEETEGYIEICVPVDRSIPNAAEVYTRELEGGAMASTVHHGPYQEIAPAYHTLTGWVSEHGHELAGPPRETYLNDPQVVLPEDLLTRVDFPIVPQPD
ncbi:Transcriptional regulator, MerR family [hydrothermal vent metagenome]|uniref:Transcriptional regulator, MerR family n=1 Tax=hydrothermal vent metagenome TaxID=652676 RepID=A0A3B0SPF1_9ZZZZ